MKDVLGYYLYPDEYEEVERILSPSYIFDYKEIIKVEGILSRHIEVGEMDIIDRGVCNFDLIEAGAKLGYLKYVWWYIYSVLSDYNIDKQSEDAIFRIRERIHRIPRRDVDIIRKYFVGEKPVIVESDCDVLPAEKGDRDSLSEVLRKSFRALEIFEFGEKPVIVETSFDGNKGAKHLFEVLRESFRELDVFESSIRYKYRSSIYSMLEYKIEFYWGRARLDSLCVESARRCLRKVAERCLREAMEEFYFSRRNFVVDVSKNEYSERYWVVGRLVAGLKVVDRESVDLLSIPLTFKYVESGQRGMERLLVDSLIEERMEESVLLGSFSKVSLRVGCEKADLSSWFYKVPGGIGFRRVSLDVPAVSRLSFRVCNLYDWSILGLCLTKLSLLEKVLRYYNKVVVSVSGDVKYKFYLVINECSELVKGKAVGGVDCGGLSS